MNLYQAYSQRSDEKVIERILFVNDPVDIGNITVKGVKIDPGHKFSAKSVAEQGGGQEEDWLENLEFTVNNKSDKRVTYLLISLRIPLFENHDRSGGGMFYHFVFGIDLRASGQAATYAEPFSLDAGASHTVRLSDKGLKEIKSRLESGKKSLAEINKAFLEIPIVGYEDGLQWHLGKYLRPEKQRQSDNKVIERARRDNEPCEIGRLRVKNVKITSSEKLVSSGFTKTLRDSHEFGAESVAKNGGGQAEDWLENLELAIKNNSDKQITYIGLSIQFPETEVNGPVMVDNSLGLGIHPKASTAHVNRTAPLALAPGDTAIFTLSAQQLKLMKDFLAHRKFQLAGLNKAVITIETVAFEDGITWSAGHHFKPSSSAPNGYERIDK